MPLRKFISLVALAALATLAGCKKKPPQTAPTAQQTAPSITEPATPPPTEAQPAPAPAPAPSETTPSTNTASTATTTPPPKPKPKPRPRPTSTASEKKPKQQEPAQTASNKQSALPSAAQPGPNATVRAAVPANMLLVPGMPHDEALHSRASTEQLLQATDQNLALLKRALTSDEQDVVSQVKLFMQQSRAATTDGDLIRARNLAMKAHLLSDDLVKQ